MPARDAQAQQRLEQQVRELFEQRITFNHFLGFRVETLAADRASIVFDMRPELIGHYLYGRLHGGAIATVIDATGGLATMWRIALQYPHETPEQVMDRFAHLGTVDLRIDYLRSGIGSRFTATAEVVRLGRRIASTRMELVNETGKLIATGSAAYIVS